VRVATVVGVRPQFIKASAVSRAFFSAKGAGLDVADITIHSCQHHDFNDSEVFRSGLPLAVYHG